MPYREKKIYSGKMLEVEIYPITFQDRKQSRRKKEKVSETKQKNLNDKNARKHLVRLVDTNFTDNDLHITNTYTDKELPKSEDELKRDGKNYIRRINRARKRIGLSPAKYIMVYEYKEDKTGKPIRMHIHIIMEGGLDRDTIEKLWKKGRCNTSRLQADEYGYEGLARYISKDPKGKKRWISSRNLKQPIVKVNDFKYSNRKVRELSKNQGDKQEFERLYPGYTFTSYEVNINEITAGTYLYIKMRKEDG